jgi:hypothetical protein
MTLVEIEPGRFRFVRETPPPARSDLPCPHIISDIMEPTEQVDGVYYTSKRAFRAVGRALGLTEIGDQKFKPKQRASTDPNVKKARREALQRALARSDVKPTRRR